jgi:dolichyl-phosphate beta-glucosyltransferase
MDLSVIIPALNEAAKIGYDVSVAAEFIADSGMTGEVIVVDDGSTDGTHEVALTALVPRGVKRKVLRMGKNWGKGVAVKTGILAGSGDVVLYADSGSCIPYANALPSIWRIKAGGLDLALASRKLKESVICRRWPLKRRLLSWLFHWAAVIIGGLPRAITDSQCGFKVCRGEVARALFVGLETYGFLFELEIIARAIKRGYLVEEFPVEWSCDLDTRFRPGSQAFGIFKELLRVRSISKKEKEVDFSL